MVGVDPNPFHGFDPRRLVSLCPSFDFGLGIGFARTYVASFACCETQFNERQHAAEHTRVQLPPGTAQPSVLAAELFEVKEPSHHRAAVGACSCSRARLESWRGLRAVALPEDDRSRPVGRRVDAVDFEAAA